MPDRSDDYQIPSWPPTRLDREFLNPIFKDLAVRLKAREDLEASFEALQEQGIQASLDYIQVNVAPQIANLQTSIQLAQDQINQIIIDGVSPNSLKLGGQLPAYYASAQALQDGLSGKVSTSLTINGKPLNGNITLDKTDVGLGNVDNTKDADKPISTPQANALAKRVPVDAAAGFTAAEKGRAIANVGGHYLSGYRNKIVNCNKQVNNRQSSLAQAASIRFGPDRWRLVGLGSTVGYESRPFSDGTVAKFGATALPVYQFTSVAGDANTAFIDQTNPNCRHLRPGKATLTFWGDNMSGSAATKIGWQVVRNHGVDAPNQYQILGEGVFNLGGTQRYDAVFDVPEIPTAQVINAGSTIFVRFYFDAAPNSQPGLGSVPAVGRQSGEIWLMHVSLVEGDASMEDDPYSPRSDMEEELLCARFYPVIPRLTVNGADPSAKSFAFVPPLTKVPVMSWLNIGGDPTQGLAINDLTRHGFRYSHTYIGAGVADFAVFANAE